MRRALRPLITLGLLCAACQPEADSAAPVAHADDPTGDWVGTIAGHAAFTDDWEDVPYCGGNVFLTVSERGDLTGAGTCDLLWGPSAGAVLLAELEGSLTDDTIEVEIALTGREGGRGWAQTTATGVATTSELSASGQAAYRASTGDIVEGWLHLRFAR